MSLQRQGGFLVVERKRVPQARTRVLVVHPSDDGDFAHAAESIFDAVGDSPTDLENRLRARWPRAAVRRRELADETFDAWYVYRDGRWTTAAERRELEHE